MLGCPRNKVSLSHIHPIALTSHELSSCVTCSRRESECDSCESIVHCERGR